MAEQKQVFISYSWNHRPDEVRKMAKHIESKGYKVWIDINEMAGSTFQAMAEVKRDLISFFKLLN